MWASCMDGSRRPLRYRPRRWPFPHAFNVTGVYCLYFYVYVYNYLILILLFMIMYILRLTQLGNYQSVSLSVSDPLPDPPSVRKPDSISASPSITNRNSITASPRCSIEMRAI